MYKLVINLKTYQESFDKNAIKIAKICKKLEKKAKQKNVEIILCPQNLDIKDIIKEKISTYAQHIDDYEPGKYTGFISADALKQLKAKGTLINHSEHQIKQDEIKKRIQKAKELKLTTCVCARTAAKAKEIAKLKPDYIAVEPKELIGGDISISTAKPQLITNSLKAVGKVPLLVGAGIKNKNDVKKSIELGAKGILVASGVIKVKNIEKAIDDLLDGF